MKRILISLLLCPLTMMAMEETEEYIGITTELVNRVARDNTHWLKPILYETSLNPISRKTLIYKSTALNPSAFEYVTHIDALKVEEDKRLIPTYNDVEYNAEIKNISIYRSSEKTDAHNYHVALTATIMKSICGGTQTIVRSDDLNLPIGVEKQLHLSPENIATNGYITIPCVRHNIRLGCVYQPTLDSDDTSVTQYSFNRDLALEADPKRTISLIIAAFRVRPHKTEDFDPIAMLQLRDKCLAKDNRIYKPIIDPKL